VDGISPDNKVAPSVILVVDDEPDLVVTHARLPRRHGSEVMTATGRESALAIIQSLTAQPAVVIAELRLSADEGGNGHGQGPSAERLVVAMP